MYKAGKEQDRGWYPQPVPYPREVATYGDHPDHKALPKSECLKDQCYWHGKGNYPSFPRPISRERERNQEPRPDTPVLTRKSPGRRTTTITVVQEDTDYDASDDEDDEYHIYMINAEKPETEVGPQTTYWRNPDCSIYQEMLMEQEEPYGDPCPACCANRQNK